MTTIIKPVTLKLGDVTGVLIKGPLCDQPYPPSSFDLLLTSDIFHLLECTGFFISRKLISWQIFTFVL